MKADEILDALIALSHNKVWATELPFRGSTTRIDFWTLETTLSKEFRTSSYEIKVSKTDFKRDSRSKQEGAIRSSDRFWYVTPPELISKTNIPEWAGLMEWDGERFSIKRKPPKHQKREPSWGMIVDVIRNSGQCRRDVQLLTDEIRNLRWALNREQSRNEIANKMRLRDTVTRFSRQKLPPINTGNAS